MSIKVSICCLAYNHEKYIRQCLDGFIMQKTDFSFEVLINDDASTDKTADIIREYEKKYPDIIKPIYQTENQYSKGISISKTFNFPRIQGEYVAMCEGDDYWTDPLKLQKQVDFLDNNPDYSICFHKVVQHFETGLYKDSIIPDSDIELDLEGLLYRNFIPTASVMYRWILNKDNIEISFPGLIIPGDWYLHLLHAKNGKIGLIDEVMGVYRTNPNGIWYNVYINPDKHYLTFGFDLMRTQFLVYKNFANKSKEFFNEMIIKQGLSLFQVFIKHKKYFSILKFLIKYPLEVNMLIYLKIVEKINKLVEQIKKTKTLIFIYLKTI